MTPSPSALPDRPRAPTPSAPKLAVNLDLAKRFCARAEAIGVDGAEVLNVCMGDWLRRYAHEDINPDRNRQVDLRMILPGDTHTALMRECERRHCAPPALIGLLLATLNED